MICQLKIKSELDRSWSERLGEVQITTERQEDGSGVTIRVVDAADQSTLFGILERIRDLNMDLISVTKNSQKIRSLSRCRLNVLEKKEKP